MTPAHSNSGQGSQKRFGLAGQSQSPSPSNPSNPSNSFHPAVRRGLEGYKVTHDTCSLFYLVQERPRERLDPMPPIQGRGHATLLLRRIIINVTQREYFFKLLPRQMEVICTTYTLTHLINSNSIHQASNEESITSKLREQDSSLVSITTTQDERVRRGCTSIPLLFLLQ